MGGNVSGSWVFWAWAWGRSREEKREGERRNKGAVLGRHVRSTRTTGKLRSREENFGPVKLGFSSFFQLLG